MIMSTKFKHKNLPVEISYKEWSDLSDKEKSNFTIHNEPVVKQVTNYTTTTITNNKTDDLLGIGKVAEVGGGLALVPVAIIGGFLGMFRD